MTIAAGSIRVRLTAFALFNAARSQSLRIRQTWISHCMGALRPDDPATAATRHADCDCDGPPPFAATHQAAFVISYTHLINKSAALVQFESDVQLAKREWTPMHSKAA